MKRIIITESQYDKLLISEQNLSDVYYYCIKKEYSTKGKVIMLDDRKAFKMVNKNNDKLYFIEDGKFLYIQNGKGWKNTGEYNCSGNEYVIKNKKGKLYDFINNFLTKKPTNVVKTTTPNVKSTENSDICIIEGKKLRFIKDKFDGFIWVAGKGSKGCNIESKGSNNTGVNYTLFFIEKPNIFQLELSSDNGIVFGDGVGLKELFKGSDGVISVINNNPKNIVINGSYKIEKVINEQESNFEKVKEKATKKAQSVNNRLGAFYMQVVEVDGKEPSKAKYDNKINNLVNVLTSIINNTTPKGGSTLTPEQIKKKSPVKYYTSRIRKSIEGKSEEEFYKIIVNEMGFDCNLLKKIKEHYSEKFGNTLRNDWNKNMGGISNLFGDSSVVDDMSDYLQDGGCSQERFNIIKNKKI